MAGAPPEEHQERATRQRRLGDAAKLLPVLAALLMLFPTLWGEARSTSMTLIYIFVVWAALIVTIAFLSRALARYVREGQAEQDESK
ncbi:MAG: hypothetical protein OIF48_04990 [Silicimonas sp.]|nr:hypothetical protein [Silicimonas sp.]